MSFIFSIRSERIVRVSEENVVFHLFFILLRELLLFKKQKPLHTYNTFIYVMKVFV